VRGDLVPAAGGVDRRHRAGPQGRRMIRLPLVLLFSAFLFSAGVYGVLARKNAIMVVMAIELMLNAVNVNLVAFSAWLGDLDGQVFALFVIAVAAAEVGIGLAIVILLFRTRESINVDEVNLLKW
ncbi:MAG TPA: NADH-quinone oxidoreductase subunit NuoK, partial [Actinomycetota bacterium]|nr:NADH-quinone oxidoreductase subunit NuoK [Actinomycetota bacterium]